VRLRSVQEVLHQAVGRALRRARHLRLLGVERHPGPEHVDRHLAPGVRDRVGPIVDLVRGARRHPPEPQLLEQRLQELLARHRRRRIVLRQLVARGDEGPPRRHQAVPRAADGLAQRDAVVQPVVAGPDPGHVAIAGHDARQQIRRQQAADRGDGRELRGHEAAPAGR
jgi:hypothetical protein